ncbi:hypothetical protein F4861DRAFT_533969 [Xylaria intraflava]|nr:hypothetical protein F4861DRAFT_533969 [Xylaria intraflava]
MARRPPPPGSSVLPPQTRQNEYFVPRDGIDREVITADICRYLGNDALVRPGTYENPENGQVIQGYFINAYRNLTSAMIQDLKADSSRWDLERRQQSANRSTAGGGTIASNGVFIRSSDNLPVQYRNSDIHQARQYHGPTESTYSAGNTGNDPFDNGLRYPGTGSSGYNGAASSYPQQYGASPGGYTQQAYPPNSGQFAPPPPGNVGSYGSGHSVAAPGYSQAAQDPPYNIVGADFRAGSRSQTDPYAGDPYGASRDPRVDPRDQRIPVTTAMPPARATYATAGPSSIPGASVPGYPASGPNTSYYPPNATSSSGPYPPSTQVQPGEPFYGRAHSDYLASPGGTATYNVAPDQQYENTPTHERMSGPPQNTQPPASGSRHRSERDSVERHTERHPDPRHNHRSHRTAR